MRLGFVKVSEPHPGGELVLAYLGRGGYFGEIGLLGEGRRTATCTALDHVELVRIHAEEFHQMVDQFPDDSPEPGNGWSHERQEQNRQRLATATSTPLDAFLTQGLMEAQSLLVMDLERCTRCDACVRACADAHDGVTRLIREGQRFDKYLVATSCRHCRDPLCMVGLSGGLHPAPQFAGSDHRELVHRLRPVRQELPVRQHQHASVHRDGERSDECRAARWRW